jgi:putative hydrolase of the HAD superfamily
MVADVRALCFDLDDTFWPVRPVLVRAEQRMQDFLRREHPQLAAQFSVDRLFEWRRTLAAEAPERAHDMTWLRTEAMRRWTVAQGHDPAIADDAFAVFIAARHDVEFYPDVLPALRKLGERFLLATLSNGNADVRRIGIGAHFALVANAESIGAPKPQARAFHHVATSLGIEPQQLLHVGDDPTMDVVGAREAGCCAVWLNRDGRDWPAEIAMRADYEVRDLGELALALTAPYSHRRPTDSCP